MTHKKRPLVAIISIVSLPWLIFCAIAYGVGYQNSQVNNAKIDENIQPVGALLSEAQLLATRQCNDELKNPQICHDLQLFDMTSYATDFEKYDRYTFYFSNSNDKAADTIVYSATLLANGNPIGSQRESIEHLDNGKKLQ